MPPRENRQKLPLSLAAHFPNLRPTHLTAMAGCPADASFTEEDPCSENRFAQS